MAALWGNRSNNRIEQQLERPMRLRAFQDLGTEENCAALANSGLERDHTVLQIALAPAPSAAERRLGVEPPDTLDAGCFRASAQPEHRTVVEEDVQIGRASCRERVAMS